MSYVIKMLQFQLVLAQANVCEKVFCVYQACKFSIKIAPKIISTLSDCLLCIEVVQKQN